MSGPIPILFSNIDEIYLEMHIEGWLNKTAYSGRKNQASQKGYLYYHRWRFSQGLLTVSELHINLAASLSRFSQSRALKRSHSSCYAFIALKTEKWNAFHWNIWSLFPYFWLQWQKARKNQKCKCGDMGSTWNWTAHCTSYCCETR